MNPILAAGVVVLRDGADEREVLTVHRPHRSDWSLPKGKLEPGEHPIVTAVRECDEETGYTVTLGSPLPTLDYEVDGEPKRVWYWRAEVRNNEEFIPDDEVDEIQWVPLSDIPTALSYPSDIATVSTAAATPQTSPFILLRHTQAMKRADFKGSHDAERPLSGKGRTQSKALVPLLDAYGITEVHASDTTRCVETVRRYAKSIAVDVHREDTLTESGHDRHPNRAKRRIVELAERPEPIVVCSHRPVLPTVIQALQRHLNWPDIPDIWDPKLPPGGFIVVHRAFTENGHIEPIAVERHTLSR
jgi:8-oxo-dGTP diphosphatase